jgi:HSP20 family protein
MKYIKNLRFTETSSLYQDTKQSPMHSYRGLSRIPLTQAKRILFKTPSRKMSLFPRSFISEPATSFGPLFRLLDDFDSYQSTSNRYHHRSDIMESFSPKFDVKELPETYELHGELPGIEQKDVEIEFADDHTLTVKGHTEHRYVSGMPPARLVEASKANGEITEGGETTSHNATVEDIDEDAPATTEPTDVAKADVTTDSKPEPKAPEAKYWVSERSVGEFSRSFSFPVRVDLEGVSASMKNGILSIVVPKAKKNESRKITIN